MILRSGGINLPFRFFDKSPRVTQATIVENKRLDWGEHAAADYFIRGTADTQACSPGQPPR